MLQCHVFFRIFSKLIKMLLIYSCVFLKLTNLLRVSSCHLNFFQICLIHKIKKEYSYHSFNSVISKTFNEQLSYASLWKCLVVLHKNFTIKGLERRGLDITAVGISQHDAWKCKNDQGTQHKKCKPWSVIVIQVIVPVCYFTGKYAYFFLITQRASLFSLLGMRYKCALCGIRSLDAEYFSANYVSGVPMVDT